LSIKDDRFCGLIAKKQEKSGKDIIIFILCEEYDLLYIVFRWAFVCLPYPESSGAGLGERTGKSDGLMWGV